MLAVFFYENGLTVEGVELGYTNVHMEEENQQQENNINQESEQPQSDAPKSKKGLVIILLIVSLLIVSGAIAGYYYLSSLSESEIPTPPSSTTTVENVEETVVKSQSIESVFIAYNECTTISCFEGHLDGFMLEQLNSGIDVSDEKKLEVLKAQQFASYKGRTELNKNYGAYFVSDYTPKVNDGLIGGIVIVHLFENINGEWKLYHRLNPESVTPELTPNIIENKDLSVDTDGDGLTDYEETNTYFTNPVVKDTDGDSHSDGDEIEAGYNPLGEGIYQGIIEYQTYTNGELGLKFDHPVGTKILVTKNASDDPILRICSDENILDETCAFQIGGNEIRISTTNETNIEEIKYQYSNDPESKRIEESITVAGLPAKKVTVFGSVKLILYWAQVINDGKLYTLLIVNEKRNANQIISSLEFIK